MSNLISINAIARKLKMQPKAARRRLRGINDVPASQHHHRWQYTPADAKKVEAALRKSA